MTSHPDRDSPPVNAPPPAAEPRRCANCDYSLVGLNFDGLCPECGYSIRKSLKATPFSGLSQTDRRCLSRGVEILEWLMIGMLLLLPLSPALLVIGDGVGAVVTIALLYVCLLVGCAFIAAVRSERTPRDVQVPRAVLRILFFSLIAVVLVGSIATVWNTNLTKVAIIVAAGLTPLIFLAAVWRIGALRDNDPEIARGMRRILGWIGAAAATAVLGLVLTPVLVPGALLLFLLAMVFCLGAYVQIGWILDWTRYRLNLAKAVFEVAAAPLGDSESP